MSVGPSTEIWAANQRPHPQIKWTLSHKFLKAAQLGMEPLEPLLSPMLGFWLLALMQLYAGNYSCESMSAELCHTQNSASHSLPSHSPAHTFFLPTLP